MHIFEEQAYINNSSVALGFFDAIHSGHKVVLKNMLHKAKEFKTESVVLTFKKHPLYYLSQEKPELILTNDEKLEILRNLGINNVIFQDFNKICTMYADDYIKSVLSKYYSPVAITTGFNHTFGYKKEGNGSLLKKYEKQIGYKYFEIPPFVIDGETVSCSIIRNKLRNGDIYGANKLLGYNFFIQGIVEEGEHIASKLNFPSANITYPEEKVRVPHGVYYVTVELENKSYDGILNFGFGPATGNTNKEKTEVHILGLNDNLYGKKIKISFVTKIRNQINFENTDKLKAQILRDIAFTEIYKKFQNTNINFTCKKFL